MKRIEWNCQLGRTVGTFSIDVSFLDVQSLKFLETKLYVILVATFVVLLGNVKIAVFRPWIFVMVFANVLMRFEQNTLISSSKVPVVQCFLVVVFSNLSNVKIWGTEKHFDWHFTILQSRQYNVLQSTKLPDALQLKRLLRDWSQSVKFIPKICEKTFLIVQVK